MHRCVSLRINLKSKTKSTYNHSGSTTGRAFSLASFLAKNLCRASSAWSAVVFLANLAPAFSSSFPLSSCVSSFLFFPAASLCVSPLLWSSPVSESLSESESSLSRSSSGGRDGSMTISDSVSFSGEGISTLIVDFFSLEGDWYGSVSLSGEGFSTLIEAFSLVGERPLGLLSLTLLPLWDLLPLSLDLCLTLSFDDDLFLFRSFDLCLCEECSGDLLLLRLRSPSGDLDLLERLSDLEMSLEDSDLCCLCLSLSVLCLFSVLGFTSCFLCFTSLKSEMKQEFSHIHTVPSLPGVFTNTLKRYWPLVAGEQWNTEFSWDAMKSVPYKNVCMSVCIGVCVHVWVHVWVHAWVRVWVRVWVSEWMSEWMSMCECVCIHVWVCECEYVWEFECECYKCVCEHEWVRSRVRECECVHFVFEWESLSECVRVPVHMRVCVCVCVCTCMCECMCTCMCVSACVSVKLITQRIFITGRPTLYPVWFICFPLIHLIATSTYWQLTKAFLLYLLTAVHAKRTNQIKAKFHMSTNGHKSFCSCSHLSAEPSELLLLSDSEPESSCLTGLQPDRFTFIAKLWELGIKSLTPSQPVRLSQGHTLTSM